jgi:hypothetical protein
MPVSGDDNMLTANLDRRSVLAGIAASVAVAAAGRAGARERAERFTAVKALIDRYVSEGKCGLDATIRCFWRPARRRSRVARR